MEIEIIKTIHTNFFDVFKSPWFWSPFFGWCTAQFIKLCINFCHTRKIDFSYFVSTGGMPSAHSAMVSALATSIGMTEGFDSPVFALALSFAAVTMFDAAGVRFAASQQAKLLNKITEELFTEHRFNVPRLKELLGHTRKEVLGGLVTGVIVAIIVINLMVK